MLSTSKNFVNAAELFSETLKKGYDAAVQAGYVVNELIVKAGNPFTKG